MSVVINSPSQGQNRLQSKSDFWLSDLELEHITHFKESKSHKFIGVTEFARSDKHLVISSPSGFADKAQQLIRNYYKCFQLDSDGLTVDTFGNNTAQCRIAYHTTVDDLIRFTDARNNQWNGLTVTQRERKVLNFFRCRYWAQWCDIIQSNPNHSDSTHQSTTHASLNVDNNRVASVTPAATRDEGLFYQHAEIISTPPDGWNDRKAVEIFTQSSQKYGSDQQRQPMPMFDYQSQTQIIRNNTYSTTQSIALDKPNKGDQSSLAPIDLAKAMNYYFFGRL